MTRPADPIALFVAPLASSGLRYVVTGAFAASAYGDPRLTNDIDVVLEAAAGDAARLHALFARDDLYVPPVEVLAAESSRASAGHFNVVHGASGLRADVYLAGNDPLHQWALDHARSWTVGDVAVHFAPPEYVILRKLEYLRDGASPKHLSDIRAMLARSADAMDLAWLQESIRQRGLEALWARARG